MTQLMNDNEGPSPTVERDVPEAHGQAAMLLVESLIHGLIARSILPVEEAIDIVTVAIDVQLDVSTDRGDHDDATNKSLAMLRAIRRSLSRDVR